MKRPLLLNAFFILFTPIIAQTVKDVDNNVYKTVTIGTQVWMAENLKTTHYRNGDSIPYVLNDITTWENLTKGAYAPYNGNIFDLETYGCLYNWYAVADNRNIAPVGWHVPSQSDWEILFNYLGGDNIASAELKESGTAHWKMPNSGATNSTGFTALAAGYISSGPWISFKLSLGLWWTSNETSGKIAKYYSMYYNTSSMLLDSTIKFNGLSIRCVKDLNTSLTEVEKFHDIFIYPNPAKDYLIIKKLPVIRERNVRIFDLAGHLVFESQIENEQIYIQFLNPGIYVLKIDNNNFKFIKQ